MSVAFTREEDSEAAAANLPDRPMSTHPNLVTRAGLAQLDAALEAAREAYAAAQHGEHTSSDRSAMARATRDLRYYAARRASAQLRDKPSQQSRVAFGCTVTFEHEDGQAQQFRIVGEDEADPSRGSVSYLSPLAQALLSKEIGDTAQVVGRQVEVLAIE